MDDNEREREVVRSVLRSKLTLEELNLFENTDLDPLARNGFMLASIFAAADENSLEKFLPGRLGLVRLFLTRFLQSHPPAGRERPPKRLKLFGIEISANLEEEPKMDDTVLGEVKQLRLEVKDMKLKMHIPSSSTFQDRGRIMQDSTGGHFYLHTSLAFEEVEALWLMAEWDKTMKLTPEKRFKELVKHLIDSDSLHWKIGFT